MSERTEYRIIPVESLTGRINYYLQFKVTESGVMRPWWKLGPGIPWTKSTWRFIPRDDYMICSGDYVRQEDCPKQLDYYENGRWVGGFLTEQADLEAWARRHPDVEVHFEKRRAKHAKYVKQREDERRDCKIIYLSDG